MNEQEQAQALADWLAQPVGAPAPVGLDPDVLESVYAMQPERAPAPSLTADDIFADFEALAAGGGGEAPVSVPVGPVEVAPIPTTEVSAAPTWWRAANRVGGLGVLMATAATLLLVVLPTMQSSAPDAASVEEVAAAAAPGAAEKDAVEQQMAPPAEAVAEAEPPPPPAAPAVIRGDGVAALDEPEPDRLDMASGRAGADAMIPEVAAAAADPVPEPLVAEAELDAVAALDDVDMAEDEGLAFDVGGMADEAPMAEAESAKSRPRPARTRKENKAEASAPGLVEEVAEPTAAASPPAGNPRNAAVPSDLSSRWRNGVDAASLAAIDQALAIGETEARSGQYATAANAVRTHVRPPAAAGQYVAAKAVGWYLAAGDTSGAISTAQAGLSLSQENTPWRSWLLVLYGDAQAARGDQQGANAAYSQAATLNAAR